MANNTNIERPVLIEAIFAGFHGDVTTMSKTLRVLNDTVMMWRNDISHDLVKLVMEKAIILMDTKSREILKECVNHVHLILNVLPKDVYIYHVKNIINSMSKWKDTTVGHFRREMKNYLKKLIKVYGLQEIQSILPKEGIIVKMVDNIKKTQRTLENKKARAKIADPDESQDGYIGDVSTNDIEALLEDSSDDETPVKKTKIETVIRESEDIMNLADPSAGKHILTNTKAAKAISRKERHQDPNIKMAEDGRMVVSMPRGEDDEEPLMKGDIYASDTSGDEESVADSFNGMDDVYEHGGDGIHRNLKKSEKPAEKPKQLGENYRGKGKRKHDVKRKDQPDPYAYVPLNAGSLNKRKKKMLQSNFKKQMKAIQSGKTKGKRTLDV